MQQPEVKAEEKFKVLNNIARIQLKITTLSPLLIKSGESELLPSSKYMKCIRNSDNEVIIPGSSLKGFFRGNLERLSNNIPASLVQNSFGSQTFGSNYFFDEFLPNLKTIRFE
jgi:CRISPR/Cas system CSM-associated protein Csm3 (group 7 of RAMP superfamily)